MRHRVASMFSGIGGICLGFKQAGFEIVWANDIDRSACMTYRHNFGDRYLVEGDIHDIDADSLPDFEVLTAGFPCQPFSIAGRQKGFKDKRGNLFFEITRIVDVKRPPAIFLENVANLIDHDEGKTFLVIYNSLAQFGYTVYYKVMAANNYGNLPQIRKRIYIVALRGEEKIYHHPDPIPLKVSSDQIINRHIKKDSLYYYNGLPLYDYLRDNMWDKDAIYRITDHEVRRTKNAMCPTLTANMGTYPDRVPVVWDDYGIRKLTIRECLDFQGFPKSFEFPKEISLNDKYKQLGNTVCVPVIKSIADNIHKVLSNL